MPFFMRRESSLSRVQLVPAKAWYKETPGTCDLSSTAHAVMIPEVDYVTALAQKKFAIMALITQLEITPRATAQQQPFVVRGPSWFLL
eukprot:1826602-Rhodomonas_salina.1